MTTPTLSALAGLTEARRCTRLARELEPRLSGPAASGPARRATAAEAVRALAAELDTQPLDQLVVAACQGDPAVRGRCRRTSERNNGEATTVTLGEQTVSHVETARVELEVADGHQLLVEVTITLELAFALLELEVVDGRIDRVRPAAAEASLTLEAAGVEVACQREVPVTFGDPSAEVPGPGATDRPPENGGPEDGSPWVRARRALELVTDGAAGWLRRP